MITDKGAIIHQARAKAVAKANGQAARVTLELLGKISAKNRFKSVTAAIHEPECIEQKHIHA